VIVADTGAVLALLDRSDRHHTAVRKLYEERPDAWLLPWAILPEIDYLVASELGARAQEAFLADLADGSFAVELAYTRISSVHRRLAANTGHSVSGWSMPSSLRWPSGLALMRLRPWTCGTSVQ